MLTFTPGDIFPDVQVNTRDGNEKSLIPRANTADSDGKKTPWYAVFIYRGRHCPICKKYLNKLQEKLASFEKINTHVIAVSADSVAQLNQFYEDDINEVTFPVYAGLTMAVMKSMGLYLTEPMSSSETDHIFSEPALFVINGKREIQIIEKASAPFVRPEIDQLLGGIEFSQKKDYPIRGTH